MVTILWVVVEVGSGRVCQVFVHKGDANKYVLGDEKFYRIFRKALIY